MYCNCLWLLWIYEGNSIYCRITAFTYWRLTRSVYFLLIKTGDTSRITQDILPSCHFSLSDRLLYLDVTQSDTQHLLERLFHWECSQFTQRVPSGSRPHTLIGFHPGTVQPAVPLFAGWTVVLMGGPWSILWSGAQHTQQTHPWGFSDRRSMSLSHALPVILVPEWFPIGTATGIISDAI